MSSENKKDVSSLFEEIVGLIVIALSIFFSMALFTHSPSDPSLNSYSTVKRSVDNLGGVVGAYVSDIYLQLFGTSSYIIPAITVIIGIFLLLKRKIRIKEVGKVTGFGLFLISSAALLSLSRDGWLFSAMGGGLVGNTLSSLLTGYLNYTGAYLFTSVLLLLS